MKTIILFTLLAFLSQFSFGQSQCGTPTNFPNTIPTYNTEQGGLYDESPICVRVFFHIVRRSNGTGGYSPADIPQLLARLNTAYNPHNILIVNAGQDFINNDVYAIEFNDGEFNALVSTQSVSNAVNFYLLPVNPFEYAGRASAIPGNSLVVGFDVINTSTSPHELGHCLNLFHTHHQIEQGGCNDIGSNCSTCGDFICDTPVDPGLSCGSNVDPSTCAYIGGGAFNPDTRNFMSYSCRVPACRDRFSTGQGLRMRTSLRFDPMLSNFITTSCVNITGSGNLCLNNINQYSIQNPPGGATFNWSISSTNIAQIQGATNGSSVNVIRINDGKATLRCDITLPNGSIIFATKEIQVGKPMMSDGQFTKGGQSMPLAVFGSTNTLCQGVESTVTGIWQTANSVSWTGPGYSHPSVWNDYGFNNSTKLTTMKLHIYQVPGTGNWTVTGTNGCGSTSYNISFNATSCSGDPCTYYKISPNPVKNGEIIIVAKPAPIECPPLDPLVTKINIYSESGKLLQSKQFSKATKSTNKMSVLQKGLLIVEIVSGSHTERHKIISQ